MPWRGAAPAAPRAAGSGCGAFTWSRVLGWIITAPAGSTRSTTSSSVRPPNRTMPSRSPTRNGMPSTRRARYSMSLAASLRPASSRRITDSAGLQGSGRKVTGRPRLMPALARVMPSMCASRLPRSGGKFGSSRASAVRSPAISTVSPLRSSIACMASGSTRRMPRPMSSVRASTAIRLVSGAAASFMDFPGCSGRRRQAPRP